MTDIYRHVEPPESQGCQSGLHAQNRAKESDDPWQGIFHPGSIYDNPVNFALFGLARQTEAHFPDWVSMNPAQTILDIGPGKKLTQDAVRLDYPEFDFDDPNTSHRSLHNQTSKFDELARMAAEGQLPDMYLPKPSQEGSGLTFDNRWLPWEDESVGGIMAVNILEHLWEPRPFMAECARVLAPGCPLNIYVPHGLSQMYIQDLDHKKPFNMDSFKNWLFNPFYGERETPFRIGSLFKFAIKDGNEGISVQLLKTQRRP